MTEKEDAGENCGRINWYQNRDPRNYIDDGEPRALYWYRYREMHYLLKEYLKAGQKVPAVVQLDGAIPSDAPVSRFSVDPRNNLFEVPIVFVGNNLLTPFNFDIRKKDRSILSGVEYPGISATIAFSENLAETCGGIFDRDCRRQDRMYCIPVSKIEECNYSVYYLPTENMPLHVRLVHNIHETNPQEHLPPFNDRKLLAEAFMDGKTY